MPHCHEFPKTPAGREAEALSPAAFLTWWGQAQHPHDLVDGASPWNDTILERREVIGSVAILPDTVAVVARPTEIVCLDTLGVCMIAALGDNQGGWGFDASCGWLGLADRYF
ncbi:MAG: hypothetical protein K2R93_15980 [Gemmatimonadaceae bacterium]|nr:hypothetical protein [Gemmatimonadaceae bacterium]